MFNLRRKTRIATIVGGEFIEGRSYIISGKLGNNGISRATLHMVIRRPGELEYSMNVQTDDNGNFCNQIIADVPGSYFISVEFNGVSKFHIRTTEISLTVAIIEVPTLPEFMKQPDSECIHI